MTRVVDLTGRQFDRLTVIERAYREGTTRSYWLCLCKCGKQKVIVASVLVDGRSRSCGCFSLECSRKKGQGAGGFGQLYNNYRNNARNREIEFKLTQTELAEITKNNCYFCDLPPQQVSTSSNKKPVGKAFSAYTYNGIDRLDSKVGYIYGNCVPCCKRCNYAKRDYTVTEFLDWAKRVVAHSERK